MPEINGHSEHFILRSPDSCVNPYLASAIIIQAGLAGVRNKEQLPPPLDINSRFLTEDRSAYLDTLPLSIEDAIECASNSDFINNSNFKDIANHYIETIKTRV